MKKMNDWNAKPEMNKHAIDWMCKKWDDWDAKPKMNAENLDFRTEWDDFDYMNRMIAG